MKTTRLLTVLTAFLLIFSLAACGTSKGNKKNDGNKRLKLQLLWQWSRARRTKQPSSIKN